MTIEQRGGGHEPDVVGRHIGHTPFWQLRASSLRATSDERRATSDEAFWLEAAAGCWLLGIEPLGWLGLGRLHVKWPMSLVARMEGPEALVTFGNAQQRGTLTWSTPSQ
jgi:hypothetical protein